MNGQTMNYNKTLVDEFLKSNNPYKKNKPLQFDMRGYASYVKKNNIQTEQIGNAIFEKFKK